ncbi:hypothetical protein KAI32_04260 [Candidatus Pacearchaeota archaeon]|nr:hypothetical protein [Candidatus Pacearchaeota archaeon]
MVNGKIGSLNIILLFVLLIGLNVNFIGADFNESVDDILEDDVVELVEEIVDDVLIEDVLDEGEIVESVEDDLFSDDININVSDEIGEGVEVNVSEEVVGSVGVNVTGGVNENVSVNVTEDVNFSEGGVEYIDIDDLIGEVDLIENKSLKKIENSLVEDSQTRITFNASEDEEVKIEIKEIMKGDFIRVVRISSDVHFDDELRVYSDLPMPALEENIRIFWENEGVFVLEDIEYFDVDEDGLIERVSWIVPHLSTQYYNIEIIVDGNESGETINLTVSSPDNGSTVSNPIIFDINVDYKDLSKVACMLEIEGINKSLILIEGEESMDRELSSGSNNWAVECWDEDILGTSKVSTSGNFNVLNFSIDSLDEFYLINEDIVGNISYGEGIEFVGLELVNGTSSKNIDYNTTGIGSFIIDSSQISTPGIYGLVATANYNDSEINISSEFSVGSIDVSFADIEIDLGENVEIKLVINSGGFDNVNGYYFISVGDKPVGNSINSGFNVDEYINVGDFTPDKSGEFSVVVRGEINDISFNVTGSDTLTVTSGEDNETPEIKLYYPGWDEIVNDSVIEFLYDVDDNVDVANCNFKLYNATKYNNGLCGYGELIFPIDSDDRNLAFKGDLDINDDVKIKLENFDEGDYVWEVECYDGAGNHNEDYNCFSVDFDGVGVVNEGDKPEGYDREAEVENLIDSINSFLDKKDGFGAEERGALELLELDNDMNSYKKQLVQMDQDLKFNLKFMTEDKREIRVKEIYEDIDEMKENIILDISVESSYEYTKNSVDFSIEDIVSDYMNADGAKISDGTLRRLSEFNENLQGMLSTRVETWKLKIDYLDKTDDIILVSKKLDVDEDFEGKILEVIPSSVSEDVVFISDKNNVDSEIWEMELDEIEELGIVYYFEDDFDLADIEKTGTILFDYGEGSDGIGITGFFVGIGDTLNFFSFFGLTVFLFLGYLGFFIFGKIRIEKWKEDVNVDEILKLINKTRLLVRQNNIEAARDNYCKMGNLYKVLPKKCKMFFYMELGKIRLAINKKDVLNLVNEYEEAKDDFRKDDAIRIHSKIGDIYKKLPKEFQNKIYRRIVKKEI